MTKCTEFCTKQCDGDHHAVLISLIKVKNKETLNQFRQMLRAHLIHGFKLDAAVPDARPTFRYPLLHWATVLGKVDVLKMLLKPPFNVNPALQTKTGETALHRLLNVMDSNIKMSKVLEISVLLRDCLECVDRDKNTPFHVCAEVLASCNKRDLEHWKQVFYKMIDSVEDKSKCVDLIDQKNGTGETVLHMLSKRDALLEVVEYLVFFGASLHIQNLSGETPVEISWRFSTVPIYNFYDMIKSSNGEGRHNNNLGDVKTRSALGLSETKDYTEFFNEDKNSEREESESDEEECSFKRKVTRMNQSLINRLEEMADDGELSPPPPSNKDSRSRRPRKRRIILSDSDSEDDDTSECNYNIRSTPRVVTNNDNDTESSSGSNDEMDRKRKPKRKCSDDDDDIMTEQNEKLTHAQVCDEIRRTIQNIKELYAGDAANTSGSSTSSDEEDSDDDADDNVDGLTDENIIDNIKHLNGRDLKLDRKIKLLRRAIKKLTST